MFLPALVAVTTFLPVEALSQPANTFRAWAQRMDAHFLAKPLLTQTKGGGWKPFNRLKWLYDGRELPLEKLGAAHPRWRAVREAHRARALRTSSMEPTWRSLGPTNIAGRILSLALHPTDLGVAYAGSASGGLWRTLDGGASWTPLGDDLPSLAVGTLAFAARDPNILVMGTGEPTIGYDSMYGLGILRSTDAGETWQQTNVIEQPFRALSGYHAIDVNAVTGVMVAGSADALLRSEDDGATWSLVVEDGNWTDVKWRPGSRDSVLAVREYGGLYLSTDAGLTFARLSVGLPAAADIGGLAKIAW